MKSLCIEQHDSSDCGAACVASICAYYGREITIVKLRELLGTDISGTTVKGITEAVKKLGFESKAIRVSKESFVSGFTLPAIAHIVRKDGTSHYVVIYDIHKSGNTHTVKYMDPAKDKMQKKSIQDFFNDFDGILVLLAPNDNFLKSKEGAKSVFSSFIGLLKPHWKMFATAIAASIVLTIFGIVLSLFNKILIDEIIPYNLSKQLWLFAVVLLIVLITQTVLSAVRQHLVLYLAQKIDIPLMLGYFDHIFKLPMSFFSARKTGDIVTRFQDAGVVNEILTTVALTVVIDIAMAAIVGIILYLMNVNLFLIIIIMTILSAILIFAFKSPYKQLNKQQMEQGAILGSQIIESLNGVETVKVNACENFVMQKIETEYIKSLKLEFKGGVLSNIQGSISSLAGSMGSMALMVFGGFLVIDGSITLGTLIAFTSLAGFFIDPINRLVSLQLSIQEADISLTRLSEIYDVEEEEELEQNIDNTALIEGIGDILVDKVSFRYGSRPLTLKNISMNIPKGKKIAIIGKSGCGKTTLSKLLLKFDAPEEGKITFNGIDLKNINAFDLRDKIGCVPQNVQLFSGSILDNILIGNPDANKGEVIHASKLAGCDDFVKKLPQGYNTFLDENGGGLSGGEKQRIAFARALVKKPEFIILDEATSNLDFITEQQIDDLIFNKLENTTILIIAHRLSTIRKCDMIYIMDNGEILDFGTHEALLSKSNIYSEMWNSQMFGVMPTDACNDMTANNDLGSLDNQSVSGGGDIEYE